MVVAGASGTSGAILRVLWEGGGGAIWSGWVDILFCWYDVGDGCHSIKNLASRLLDGSGRLCEYKKRY